MYTRSRWFNPTSLPTHARSRVYIPTWLVGAHTFHLKCRTILSCVSNVQLHHPTSTEYPMSPAACSAIAMSDDATSAESTRNDDQQRDHDVIPEAVVVWTEVRMPNNATLGVLDIATSRMQEVVAIARQIGLQLSPERTHQSISDKARFQTNTCDEIPRTHWLPIAAFGTALNNVHVYALTYLHSEMRIATGTSVHARALLNELEQLSGESAFGVSFSTHEQDEPAVNPSTSPGMTRGPWSVSEYTYKVVYQSLFMGNSCMRSVSYVLPEVMPLHPFTRASCLMEYLTALQQEENIKNNNNTRDVSALDGFDNLRPLSAANSNMQEFLATRTNSDTGMVSWTPSVSLTDPDNMSPYVHTSSSPRTLDKGWQAREDGKQHEAEDGDVSALLDNTLSEFANMCLSHGKPPTVANYNDILEDVIL